MLNTNKQVSRSYTECEHRERCHFLRMLCITVLFCLNSINPLLYLLTSLMRYGHMSIQFTQSLHWRCLTIKWRNSSVRDKHLCHVRIEASRSFNGSAVTIERLDEHTHTHDIEESFRIKNPRILVGYIKFEAAKKLLISSDFPCSSWCRHTRRLRAVGRCYGGPIYSDILKGIITATWEIISGMGMVSK